MIKDNYRPSDKYLHQLLQEGYDQESKHYVTKLPCGCINLELEKPQDISGLCPVCSKPFNLIWSMTAPKFKGTV